jgi:hypothetical protein
MWHEQDRHIGSPHKPFFKNIGYKWTDGLRLLSGFAQLRKNETYKTRECILFKWGL